MKALEALRPLLPVDSLIEIEKHQQQQLQQQQLKQSNNQHHQQQQHQQQHYHQQQQPYNHHHHQQQQHHKNGRRIIQRQTQEDNNIHYENHNIDRIHVHQPNNDNNNNNYKRSPKIQQLRSKRLPSIHHDEGIPPPLSVRSTKSEPIKITKLKDFNTKPKVSKSAGQVLPSLTHKNLNDVNRYYSNHNQPPYNTGAMLNLLRLERDTRAMDVMTPKQPDFKGFWGWNQKGKNSDSNVTPRGSIQVTDWGDGGTDFEDSIDSHLVNKNQLLPLEYKSKKEMVIAEKINRVKRMQQVYSEKEKATETVIPISQSNNNIDDNNSRIMKSPIRISSPKINDMDLTDSELIQVSKYFKEVAKTSSKNLVHIPTPLKVDNSPNKDSPSPTKNEVKAHELGDLSRINSMNHIDNSSSNRLTMKTLGDYGDITDSPIASTTDIHADDLFIGNNNAADNILRWSLSLDVGDL